MKTKKTLTIMPAMALLPAGPGKCQICAVDHPPTDPHDAQTLYYGMRFLIKYGRDVTWADAMAHCSPEVIKAWRSELRKIKRWSQPARGIKPIAEVCE